MANSCNNCQVGDEKKPQLIMIKWVKKTYREIVRACDHCAVFQVMGFGVVTCKQATEKDKQRQVRLPPWCFNKECQMH